MTTVDFYPTEESFINKVKIPSLEDLKKLEEKYDVTIVPVAKESISSSYAVNSLDILHRITTESRLWLIAYAYESKEDYEVDIDELIEDDCPKDMIKSAKEYNAKLDEIDFGKPASCIIFTKQALDFCVLFEDPVFADLKTFDEMSEQFEEELARMEEEKQRKAQEEFESAKAEYVENLSRDSAFQACTNQPMRKSFFYVSANTIPGFKRLAESVGRSEPMMFPASLQKMICEEAWAKYKMSKR